MPEVAMEPAVRVREGKQGRELRISGTLASLYRPGLATTGLIWDALAAPLTVLPPARRRAILMLGLGGGSAARVARALAPRARIVGVELGAEVVDIARRHLDLDALRLDVRIADARDFLSAERGRYDAVIEDVFEGDLRAVRKPAWLLSYGYRQAAALLRPGGVFASNTIGETLAVTRCVRKLFDGLVWIGTRDYENRMVVGGRGLDASTLRRSVAAEPLLAEVMPRLSFRSV
jgi:spermidine synthase